MGCYLFELCAIQLHTKLAADTGVLPERFLLAELRAVGLERRVVVSTYFALFPSKTGRAGGRIRNALLNRNYIYVICLHHPPRS